MSSDAAIAVEAPARPQVGAPARALAWLRRNGIRIYVGCAIAYLLLPIAVIILFSFNEPTGRYNLTWGGFSADAWLHAFSITGLTEALVNSLKLAALSSIAATVLGTGMALALVRHRFFGRRVANLLVILPMTSPEIVVGSALLSFFLITGVALGFQTLALAHIMFSIGFAAIVVRSRLVSFDRSLEDAAADLGAGPLTTFRLITLPLIAPAIGGAIFLCFVISLDDFVVSNFNSGTTLTFPLYVFGASQRGIPVQVNVIATMLFAGTLLVGLLAVLFSRRRRRAQEGAELEPRA
ncbi:MAG TPA: ABC transporter permease [Solirubrobacterales bacterium]|jgi:spermidine/putrescine transport system permease protein